MAGLVETFITIAAEKKGLFKNSESALKAAEIIKSNSSVSSKIQQLNNIQTMSDKAEFDKSDKLKSENIIDSLLNAGKSFLSKESRLKFAHSMERWDRAFSKFDENSSSIERTMRGQFEKLFYTNTKSLWEGVPSELIDEAIMTGLKVETLDAAYEIVARTFDDDIINIINTYIPFEQSTDDDSFQTKVDEQVKDEYRYLVSSIAIYEDVPNSKLEKAKKTVFERYGTVL